jgi:hypothetical protein
MNEEGSAFLNSPAVVDLQGDWSFVNRVWDLEGERGADAGGGGSGRLVLLLWEAGAGGGAAARGSPWRCCRVSKSRVAGVVGGSGQGVASSAEVGKRGCSQVVWLNGWGSVAWRGRRNRWVRCCRRHSSRAFPRRSGGEQGLGREGRSGLRP